MNKSRFIHSRSLKFIWDLRLPILIIVISLLQTGILNCQTETSNSGRIELKIPRLEGEIIFDGIPDDNFWKDGATVEMVMHSPVFGIPPSEKSDVRLIVDEHYLYIGAWLMYEDPSIIRSASFKRDYDGQGGDRFGIVIDSYNDKENGLVFLTTPDALRIDGTIQRDGTGRITNNLPYNLNWNTFWDARTDINNKGWSAEIRIPMSSLRFQESGGVVKMGVIIQRWIAAKNEMNVYPAVPPNWGSNSIFKPSQAGEVMLTEITQQKPLYLTPYLLAGFQRNLVRDESDVSYRPSDDPILEAGLDLKYGITSNMVMDLTVNNDFAQVETDDQQVNLTRYSLYFPEKRLFFLERSNAFDFGFGGNDNIFYSRRIGLSDNGRPVRIYGGIRLTGRVGKWDIGFLDMQTAAFGTTPAENTEPGSQPSENFGALRFRRQVINANSCIGTMITSRLGMNGDYNFVYGADGLLRIFGEDYIHLKLVRSSDNGIVASSFRGSSRVYALWERRAKVGLGYDISYEYVGTEYEPGMGFERLHNYGYYKVALRHGWMPEEKSVLYSHSPGLEIRYFHYADDGSLMTFETKALWNFETKDKWEIKISSDLGLENLKDSLSIMQHRVHISPGQYRNLTLTADVTTPDSRPLYFVTSIESGSYFEGKRFSLRLQPTWNCSRRLELGGTYNFDRVKFPPDEQAIWNHLIGVKALYMFDTRLSINGFIQYNTGQNLISSNLRIRYNPREGNDFYLVFNEGRNQDLELESPRLPKYLMRSGMLKYTYTFTF